MRELIGFRAAPSRLRSALVAAACTGAPIALGYQFGQPTLGLIASTGSLAALYAGNGRPGREARAVGSATIGLALSLAFGSLLAGHAWIGLAGNAAWAIACTAVCAVVRARVPATVMPILLCAVGSGLPPGQTLVRGAAVIVVGAMATALSVVAAFGRGGGAVRHPVPPGASRIRLREELAHLPFSPVPLMALRCGAAVALAGSFATLVDTGRGYWAMATAGAVLARGSHLASANRLAFLRGLGTAAGCWLAAAIAAFGVHGYEVAVSLAGLTLLTELVIARNYAMAMVFVTPQATMLVAAASHATAVFALTLDRLLETVIGCLAAVAAGTLVTARWALQQRRRAVLAVLAGAVRLRVDPGAPAVRDSLERARERLLLVRERTAGERRGVRSAVEALDPALETALRIAEGVLASPEDMVWADDALDQMRQVPSILVAAHTSGQSEQQEVDAVRAAALVARLESMMERPAGHEAR
ncbi:FUSC family protein [Nocardioides sp. CER19]|uniref:FUSC family protein n=1 Tax=Nocardioides sp. CER19 TaxID=3038538 RepID=UPI002449F5EC|nr:FUSC family protein [Nocardioides sp. CER19]MDH2415263.1 FUSC family protein [Nocardioides sp. CER19]